MIEAKGNIWEYHNKGYLTVIPTNGALKNNGENVMGKGLALQAKQRFPDLPLKLGTAIKYNGNNVYLFPEYRTISFPVKHHWSEKADLRLINTSALQLLDVLEMIVASVPIKVALPKVGCGAGNLNWEEVKPILSKHLDEQFTVVDMQ